MASPAGPAASLSSHPVIATVLGTARLHGLRRGARLGLHTAFSIEPVLIGLAMLLLLVGLRLAPPARQKGTPSA